MVALSYFQHSRLFFFRTLSCSLSISTAGYKKRKERKKKKEKVLPAGQRREVLRSTTFKPLPPHLKAPF